MRGIFAYKLTSPTRLPDSMFGAGDLVGRLSEALIAFYEGLPGYAQFGAGWVARALRAKAAGMGMGMVG